MIKYFKYLILCVNFFLVNKYIKAYLFQFYFIFLSKNKIKMIHDKFLLLIFCFQRVNWTFLNFFFYYGLEARN